MVEIVWEGDLLGFRWSSSGYDWLDHGSSPVLDIT